MQKIVIAATVAMGLGLAMPAQADNIVETAKGAGNFETLLAAAQAAGLADALATGENLTVFAPTDEAFAALPDGTVEMLLKPENKDKLAAVLMYHVVPRKLMSSDLPGRAIQVKTLKADGDKTLSIEKSSKGVSVDNAMVISADIVTDNGIIHVIDKVVLPSI